MGDAPAQEETPSPRKGLQDHTSSLGMSGLLGRTADLSNQRDRSSSLAQLEQEFEALMRDPVEVQKFLDFCRPYLCQEHVMFVLEVHVLIESAHLELDESEERWAYREKLLGVIERFLAVGSDYDLVGAPAASRLSC
jgi:hypothetical protein